MLNNFCDYTKQVQANELAVHRLYELRIKRLNEDVLQRINVVIYNVMINTSM